ncbi:Hypothetical protein D9617_10g074620 [Elsinoe fawcettii]|nr:Hypothetical protein D9617_10g074620 [Elsinoe fawcettii]
MNLLHALILFLSSTYGMPLPDPPLRRFNHTIRSSDPSLAPSPSELASIDVRVNGWPSQLSSHLSLSSSEGLGSISSALSDLERIVASSSVSSFDLTPADEGVVIELGSAVGDAFANWAPRAAAVSAELTAETASEIANTVEWATSGVIARAVTFLAGSVGLAISEVIGGVMWLTAPVVLADIIIKAVPYKHFGTCDANNQVCVSNITHWDIDENMQQFDWVESVENGCSGHHACAKTGDFCGWRTINPHKVVCDWDRRAEWMRYTHKGPIMETMYEDQGRDSSDDVSTWHVGKHERKRRKLFKKILDGDQKTLNEWKGNLIKDARAHVKHAKEQAQRILEEAWEGHHKACEVRGKSWCPTMRACCP